jgi:predicted dinucleotide-binding enzyme
MRVGVLGTGMVGQALGGKMEELGHDVVVGTRDVQARLARSEPGRGGNPPFAAWLKDHPGVRAATFAEAAGHGEVVVNATAGHGSLQAIELAGAATLADKILMDVSNPLDASGGLFVCNTDSLGEQIQRAVPQARVVKTLNTVNASVMVDPSRVGDADHHVFVSGNDQDAKDEVTSILTGWLGWKHVLDLGDITSARGAEMYVALWLRLYRATGDAMVNVKVVR